MKKQIQEYFMNLICGFQDVFFQIMFCNLWIVG